MLSLKSATRQLFATANVAQRRKTQTATILYRHSFLRLRSRPDQRLVIPRSASSEESRFLSAPRRTQIPRLARNDRRNFVSDSRTGTLCARGVASNATTERLVVLGIDF